MKQVANSSLICPHCAYTIASYGYPCTTLIILVCAYYRNSQIFEYDEKQVKDVLDFKQTAAFLESKKYIVSAEVSDTKVALLPNFSKCKFDEENNIFCWCGR